MGLGQKNRSSFRVSNFGEVIGNIRYRREGNGRIF